MVLQDSCGTYNLLLVSTLYYRPSSGVWVQNHVLRTGRVRLGSPRDPLRWGRRLTLQRLPFPPYSPLFVILSYSSTSSFRSEVVPPDHPSLPRSLRWDTLNLRVLFLKVRVRQVYRTVVRGMGGTRVYFLAVGNLGVVSFPESWRKW